MNEHKYNDHSHHEEQKSIDQKFRHWKRAYHDSRFWTMLFLMLVAMVFYVVTDNFGSLSRSPTGAPVLATPAK